MLLSVIPLLCVYNQISFVSEQWEQGPVCAGPSSAEGAGWSQKSCHAAKERVKSIFSSYSLTLQSSRVSWCCVNVFSNRFIGDLKICEDTVKQAWEVYLVALSRTSVDFLFSLFFQFQTGASQQRGGQTKRPRTNPGDDARPAQKGGQQEPRVQPQPAHNGRPQEEQRHDPLLTNLMVGARRRLRCESVKGNTTRGLVYAPG